ncbi:MAG: hypothetical protein R2867_02585 [Caldilineaceae bacterium]
MSVLCCYAPHFLYRLACQADQALRNRPVALIGSDDAAWAVSPEAGALGLAAGMPPRQIRARCPEARLQPLDLPAIEAARKAWLDQVGRLELPTEAAGWGAAYLDLSPLTRDSREVSLIARDLGRSMRASLGEALQPALGWDSGKFTARAAALRTRPGRMKLVAAADEKRFLAPLPVSLLPLPPATLQQLSWLGIRTMGAFAELPEAAVWQRFGQDGKLALALARGKDKRPVRSTLGAAAEITRLSWDPGMEVIPPILAELERELERILTGLRAALQGCLGLSLTLYFADHSARAILIRLMQPTTDIQKLLWRIQHELTLLNWPDALTALEMTQETGELPVQQLSLFSSEGVAAQSIAELVTPLRARHGGIFFQGDVTEETHPLPERRSRSVLLA